MTVCYFTADTTGSPERAVESSIVFSTSNYPYIPSFARFGQWNHELTSYEHCKFEPEIMMFQNLRFSKSSQTPTSTYRFISEFDSESNGERISPLGCIQVELWHFQFSKSYFEYSRNIKTRIEKLMAFLKRFSGVRNRFKASPKSYL